MTVKERGGIDKDLGHHPRPDLPVGGRLGMFVNQWRTVTSDAWVLETLEKGYSLEFAAEVPSQGDLLQVRNTFSTPLWEEVKSLVEKGALEVVPNSQRGLGFYAHAFLRPKKSGGRRLILNLKPLNRWLIHKHFKMDHLGLILKDLGPGLWAVSLDLTDAYLHIPLRPAHRKFMRLAVGDHHFQFVSMCFGLAPAPRVFTKVMVEIGAYMRRQGARMFQYLDDWLLISADKEELGRQRNDLIRLTKRLGLLINVSKSELVPSQEVVYLGAQLFLHSGEVGLSAERKDKIQQLGRELWRCRNVQCGCS